MMRIKSVSILLTGKGWSRTEYGLLETMDGQQFIYTLQYNKDTWHGYDDYEDNIRSDFENEWEDCDDFGTDIMGLFVRRKLWEL